jgi:hypothetical protein
MLFLLNSDVSSRTFYFWISFAEASVDVDDGHTGDPWLQQALPILLEQCAWREDMDDEEWNGYRIDVVEMFEGICEVLEYDTLNSVVLHWLDSAANKENPEDRIVVFPAEMVTYKGFGSNVILFGFC